jgi:hypothetical protein
LLFLHIYLRGFQGVGKIKSLEFLAMPGVCMAGGWPLLMQKVDNFGGGGI